MRSRRFFVVILVVEPNEGDIVGAYIEKHQFVVDVEGVLGKLGRQGED
jgi:hypothetical protein